jgi:hypothetical protein
MAQQKVMPTGVLTVLAGLATVRPDSVSSSLANGAKENYDSVVASSFSQEGRASLP